MTYEELVELGKIASLLIMFGGILVILRWFKTDTVEMIRLYLDTTKLQVDAIKEDMLAIKQDVLAIREDVKDFHKKLYELQSGKKVKGE